MLLATLIRGDRMKVQVQLDSAGDYAIAVGEWFDEHYPHMCCECQANPGLTVTFTTPPVDYDGKGWVPRLHEMTGPIDLVCEVIYDCFTDLGLPPCQVVSLHLTSSMERWANGGSKSDEGGEQARGSG